ncbi:MAG TPA: PilZ domain-containing protein [Xanthobacteraceae bacterium]|nr:PilZ domain-containing protein [Xanthobacteraceae bacterium]
MRGEIRRGSKRRPISYPATLYNLDRSVICRCSIKDMSDTGARLNFRRAGIEAMNQVPQSFLLSLTESDEPLNEALLVFRTCEKVWVRESEMGVKFVKNGPKRAL